MKKYYPYKSDKPDKKYYIITDSLRKVYFGDSNYEDYTMHKDPKRKEAYIRRHMNNEDWSKSGIDTAGWWSRWYLWNLTSTKASYEDIKKRFL
jgi:hypothetical protein